MYRCHKVPIKKEVYNGFVRLVDVMPFKYTNDNLKSDEAIVRAARVSYGSGSKTKNSDESLINYLWKHNHLVPFESVVFQWHLKVPIFVQRHIVKHRMSSMNEISGRYVKFNEDFYVPQIYRKQETIAKHGSVNKQASESVNDDSDRLAKSIVKNRFDGIEQMEMDGIVKKHMRSSYDLYYYLLDKGVAKEVARMFLPQNMMTEFYFKIDLRNMYHFLKLRNDNHAQEETREVAKAMESIVKDICPVSYKAFVSSLN